MKKRKLLLRDRIAFIEDQITPDIIARTHRRRSHGGSRHLNPLDPKRTK